MVVDDSRIVHASMKQVLADTDYEIIGFCRTGEDAVESYREHRPDIVTMDIIMPGMDGLDASREILAEFPDAKIVVVSSLAYDETLDIANEIGTKGFIFKPFDREAVLKTLDEAFME
ncbi:MAG: response regulator [Firmicutes bacterium]|nr:response regulator [Bacillota bacterium]